MRNIREEDEEEEEGRKGVREAICIIKVTSLF
jgi:hypothetical protein